METVSNGKKVLLAEDYDDARMLMALNRRHWGYEVFEAIDGKDALNQAAIWCPDLIIMDISMPRLDGLEAAVSLRADPKTREIPIIMATAHTRESLLSNAIAAGATDVLIKPYKLSDLRDIVEKYLPPALSDAISHERLL